MHKNLFSIKSKVTVKGQVICNYQQKFTNKWKNENLCVIIISKLCRFFYNKRHCVKNNILKGA